MCYLGFFWVSQPFHVYLLSKLRNNVNNFPFIQKQIANERSKLMPTCINAFWSFVKVALQTSKPPLIPPLKKTWFVCRITQNWTFSNNPYATKGHRLPTTITWSSWPIKCIGSISNSKMQRESGKMRSC
jgi:hypothetical protein